jgi:oligosaccharide repeat unit polymerase
MKINFEILISIITSPLYIIPPFIEFKKNGLTASTYFFFYALFGTWLFSLLIGLRLLDENSVIAPWLVDISNLPWIQFAILNITIFYIQTIKNKKINNKKIVSISKTKIFAIFTFILTISLILCTIWFHGSISEWISDSYRRVAIEKLVINLLFPISTFTNVSSIILYTIAKREKLNLLTTATIYATCVLQLISSLASGGRSILFLYIISLYIAHKKTKIPKWIIITLISIIIIGSSGIIVYSRYQQQEAKASFTLNIVNIIEASYIGLPFIDHFELSRNYANDYGHDFCSALFSLATLPIPRVLWPDKPLQLSRLVRQAYWGDATGGIPPGLFGEAFIVFGWIGFIITGVIYGLLLKWFSNQYSLQSDETYPVATVATIGSTIGFVLVRGGLDIGIYRVGLIIIAHIICCSILFNKNRKT